MASSSQADNQVEDESLEEEEFERFDDFTLASSWERFISEVEAVCRLWLADGPKNLLNKGAVCLENPTHLYKVKFEVKYGMKVYGLEYYFEISSDGSLVDWNEDLHDLQLSFGVKEFLVIAPLSASGVILDAPEATKLLSSVAIALSNCGSTWPAFVPVHDPSRKAYVGIQNMGTVLTRRFEADLIGSQVPVRLMHLEGLYELFVSKFAFSSMDLSTISLKVLFTMKLTYRTPPNDDEDVEIQGSEPDTTEAENHENNTRSKIQWDDDCPWTEWYSAEDPVKGFELITIWSKKIIESSLDMAEIENASSQEAENWLLFPILSPILTDDSKVNTIGFSSQLRLLVDALDLSFEGQFMEDFISVENSGSDNLKSSTILPPPTVLDRVLKDLFHEGIQITDCDKSEHRSSRAIKGAPIESLFAQFCLHSLWFGNCNIRAIAMLWIEFVREVRWCWEESQPLPRMLTNGIIDLSTSLIHQKLQMLAICIDKKHQLDHNLKDNIDKQSHIGSNEESGQAPENQSQSAESFEEFDMKQYSPLRSESSDDQYISGTIEISDSDPESIVPTEDLEQSGCIRRGSAGTVGSMMLLKSFQRMHAPYTQDAPIMTEDMHEERLRAVETLGNAYNFSAQLEKDILSSDMSAFKAANPDAVFEDFIRWHSPGDWEKCEVEDSDNKSKHHKTKGSKDEWPPVGKLSERMSGHGNSWRQIWNLVPALPASEQKPLLDPNREGEKILHYLETLRPCQLLEQMVCTAFRASADTLNQTPFGDLKQMTTKMGQLYLTVASALKPLHENQVSDKDEIIADLKRLCVVFEHVEKLLILAASLHRKLSLVPRLLKVIFTDYFNYYLPTMGTGSVGDRIQKVFNMKQRVSLYERDAVANMFTPPTANQSWRKVLSMGNLLNGHEPILREIIFSMQDSTGDQHYSEARSPSKSSKQHETHRMYICGSSNDLRVALSVTSSD